jgi:serine protease
MPDSPGAAAQPTSTGTAVVGFLQGHLPALAVGTTFRGLDVVSVSRGGAYAVVRATDLRQVRAAVAGVPGIRFVEDNYEVHSLATPNDPSYGSQYGPQQMGAPTAWDTAGYGSSSIKVAVIDSGIYRAHEDFTPTSRFLTGRDYVQGDNDPQDTCGHGTHVIGTIAASTNNGKGVAGVSQATILPFKALEAVGGLFNVQCSGSAANIAQAIRDAADQGARIISMSIGGPDSTVERDAVSYAAGKGVLIVAAAGNDGSANSVDFPAAYPDSIAVAALESNKARASYSDAGPQVDIAAAGSNVMSTTYSSTSSYGTMSGTSMATPHVAGALALALSCAPTATVAQVKSALYSTAEDLGAAGRDDIFGNGLARVDRLVASLCGGTPPPPPPGNNAPTAAFTSTTSGLTANVNGTTSTDPDGDALTYSWAWGDGATTTGATSSHAYAAGGTYSVTLTVNDGKGGTDTETTSVSVTAPAGTDPDPSTPTVTSGATTNVSLASGEEKFFKISVPAGKSSLSVVVDGPACGLVGCSFDVDLYTRFAARPTDTVYACRPYASGSDETCTHSAPSAGYWYIRLDAYTGSGSVTLKATVS